MSQSCRAHLFFGVRLIQQNSRFEFFLLAYFFPSFLQTCLSKYTRKDMTDTTKHLPIFFPSFLRTCLSKYTRKDMTDTTKH